MMDGALDQLDTVVDRGEDMAGAEVFEGASLELGDGGWGRSHGGHGVAEFAFDRGGERTDECIIGIFKLESFALERRDDAGFVTPRNQNVVGEVCRDEEDGTIKGELAWLTPS